MPVADEFARVPLASIIINRPDRQRRAVDTSGIRESIRQHGVMNPIIITREFELVAGERRFTSCSELGHLDIICRYADTLNPIEHQLLELEENLKRADLPWRDATKAIGRIHELYLGLEPTWSQLQTAEAIGLSPGMISVYLKVFRNIDSPKLATASGLAAAHNLLSKADQRVADAALSDILEGGQRAFEAVTGGDGQVDGLALPLPRPGPDFALVSPPPALHNPPPPTLGSVAPDLGRILTVPPTPKPESILNESFLEWAPTYAGPKFNLIHCDFPYGINAFDGSMGAAGNASSSDLGPGGMEARKSTLYDDSPDTYWALVNCLCINLDHIMSHSGHLMFWFSMKYYTETLKRFAQLAPGLVFNPMPLVWMKSDNRGVLPDAKRGPRQIYETCLLASREDRFIVKAVSNAYSAPSDKLYHHSTKPEPVLRHFMGMLCDDTTRLLDPTCGSGSALRAAESLGAREVLGLEIDAEHCENARGALRKFRAMRRVGK